MRGIWLFLGSKTLGVSISCSTAILTHIYPKDSVHIGIPSTPVPLFFFHPENSIPSSVLETDDVFTGAIGSWYCGYSTQERGTENEERGPSPVSWEPLH